jgi:hypothetical protein
LRNQGETLLERRQQTRRISGSKELDGMRVEGHRHSRHAHRSCTVYDVRQNRLVADVNAVEAADADDRALRRIVVAQRIPQNSHPKSSADHR